MTLVYLILQCDIRMPVKSSLDYCKSPVYQYLRSKREICIIFCQEMGPEGSSHLKIPKACRVINYAADRF